MRILTIPEVAELLQIHPDTAPRMASLGAPTSDIEQIPAEIESGRR